MSSNRVAVLMSTYNGEKYIQEQIDSILAQNDINLDIYIRDDGSEDATITIIKEYAKKENVFLVPAEQNLGPGQSFMTLLYYVAGLHKYTYYAFADQDDIWLPQKLSVAIDMIKKIDVPALYGSNRIIYENEKEKGFLFQNALDNSLKRRISINEVSGCTMVFNNQLAKRVVSHKMPNAEIIDYRLHDSWMLLVALITGEIVYDRNSYILYRIHSENTVGIKKTTVSEMLKRLRKIGNGRTTRSNLRKKTAETLLEYYPDMSRENKDVLERYAYYQKSWKNKWKLMNDKEIISATDENQLIFKLKVLVNFV